MADRRTGLPFCTTCGQTLGARSPGSPPARQAGFQVQLPGILVGFTLSWLALHWTLGPVTGPIPVLVISGLIGLLTSVKKK